MTEASLSQKKATNDKGATTFLCPNCGKTTIVRSAKERAVAAKYTCHACGFTGPN